MASKDSMRSLSQRLEPVRQEFALRLYRSSLELLRPQITDDFSLFWIVPSRVIRNLRRLFRDDSEGLLRFVLISHGGCHHRALSRLGQPVPANEEVIALMGRCVDPTVSDMRNYGLLPLSTSVSRLNKRKLNSAIRARLSPVFKEKFDPSEPNERSYETKSDSWQIVAFVDTRAPYSQLELSFDIRLGMGDLDLQRQISLHRLFGLGPSGWDLTEPGEEENMAELVGEYCQFMLHFCASLLRGLDPDISREEVIQAEQEWKEWLTERRSARENASGFKR